MKLNMRNNSTAKFVKLVIVHSSSYRPIEMLPNRGVARNLIWVGINCTISNLSWVKETKQPHKKFKVG